MKKARIINEQRVYGPYLRKDGRMHVILIDNVGKRRTVSYPKYLMELKLGRQLDPYKETVDHIDNDHTNNDIGNLRLLPKPEHAKQDALRLKEQKASCIQCAKEFALTRAQLEKRSATRAGPFCSRKCSGVYGAAVQNGGAVLSGRIVPAKQYGRFKMGTWRNGIRGGLED